MIKSQKDKFSISLIRAENEYSSEFFFKYLYSYLSLPFLWLFIRAPFTPLQITIFSIALGTIAGVFFYLGDYTYLVIGVIFINLSLILDKVDGQVARLRKQSSDTGGWIDSVGDVYSLGLYFFTISIGQYLQTKDEILLILGMLCMFHVFMAMYVIETKKALKSYGPKKRNEIEVFDFYFGLVNALHVYLTLGLLLNQTYWVLCLFGIFGIAAWVPFIYRTYMRSCD